MGGNGVICKSCVYCFWMVMNGLEVIKVFLMGEIDGYEIFVDDELCKGVFILFDCMFNFLVELKVKGGL